MNRYQIAYYTYITPRSAIMRSETEPKMNDVFDFLAARYGRARGIRDIKFYKLEDKNAVSIPTPKKGKKISA